MFDDIFVALGTISKIPVPTAKRVNIKRSSCYFPLVGILAAVILRAGWKSLGLFFPDRILSLLLLGVYYYLFGYFHFDGFLDVIDGFGVQMKSPEERLKIMKDSRVGAFALLGGILLLLLQFSSLDTFPVGWFLFPVWGRLSIVILLSISKPASEKGLGAAYFPYKKIYLLPAVLFSLIGLFVSLTAVLVGFFVALVVAVLMNFLSNRKLGGINGDVLGAACIITEVMFLLLLNIKV